MATTLPPIDVPIAHRYFSAECFNRTWEWIEKAARSAADDEAMVLCSAASLWHWTQRSDCTDLNRSIGHWQLSRVLAMAQRGTESMHHARLALHFAGNSTPFFQAFGHEAIARAAAALNDRTTFNEHLKQAQALAAAIADAEDREQLEKDLKLLQAQQ